MNDPANLNVRGSSRNASRQNVSFGQEFDRSGFNALRPVTADQVPWRLTRAGSQQASRSPREAAAIAGLGHIPEGVEVRHADDPMKTRIPIFGEGFCFVYETKARLEAASVINSASHGLKSHNKRQ